MTKNLLGIRYKWQLRAVGSDRLIPVDKMADVSKECIRNLRLVRYSDYDKEGRWTAHADVTPDGILPPYFNDGTPLPSGKRCDFENRKYDIEAAEMDWDALRIRMPRHLVPVKYKVYSSTLLDRYRGAIYRGARPDTPAGAMVLRKWCETHGISYYRAKDENMSVEGMIAQMKADGHLSVIVEVLED